MEEWLRIGEVARRSGLTLRTLRHYDEVELLRPSGRSDGGFRLYTEADVARLQLIRRMKPLDFSLEEMRDLLSVRDELEDGVVDADRRTRLVAELEAFLAAAHDRVESVRRQLAIAEGFAADLETEVARQQQDPRP